MKQGLLGAALGFALACAPSYLESYRERHPGWEPVPPAIGQGLEELLASLHRESPIATMDVAWVSLEVLRPDVDPWVVTPFQDLRTGRVPLEPERDSIVLVQIACTFNPGIARETRTRWAVYLLPGGRLAAWDHVRFREDCVPISSFLPARAEAVALERGAMAALRARGGNVRIRLPETYRRGFAFVEAGRLDDARAMLEAGERMRRELISKVRAGRAKPDLLLETEGPREKLMRSLGLEPIPPLAPR